MLSASVCTKVTRAEQSITFQVLTTAPAGNTQFSCTPASYRYQLIEFLSLVISMNKVLFDASSGRITIGLCSAAGWLVLAWRRIRIYPAAGQITFMMWEYMKTVCYWQLMCPVIRRVDASFWKTKTRVLCAFSLVCCKYHCQYRYVAWRVLSFM